MSSNENLFLASEEELDATITEKKVHCLHCNKDIDDQDAIQCDNCEKWKHSKCFQRKEFEKAKDKMLWFCGVKCETDSGIDREVASITVKNPTMSDIMKCMGQFFKQYRDVNNFLKKQNLEDVKADIVKIKKENRQRDIQIENLRNEIGQLKQLQINNKVICYNVAIKTAKISATGDSDNRPLTNSANTTADEYGRQTVPTTPNEPVKTTIKPCDKPAISVIEEYIQHHEMHVDAMVKIQSAYKIKAKDSKPAPIVITFDGSDSKLKFIDQIKKSKKNNKAIKIKVSEFLTSETRELLQEAKSGLGDKFKYIWSKNGQIYVREKDDSKPIRISQSSHIRELMD